MHITCRSLEVIVQQTMDRPPPTRHATGPDTTSRPLVLHSSALSNEEFELYTRSLQELTTLDRAGMAGSSRAVMDSHYEQLSFNAGETRAWLKGRYPHVTIEKIDSILKYMNSEHGPRERLSGGQVLVVLRLLTHLMAGEHVTKERAFYQALPRPKIVRPTSENTVRAQAPKPASPTSTRPNNGSEGPHQSSTPASLINTLADQSASPSAVNEICVPSNRPSAPIITTSVQLQHSPSSASSPTNGAGRSSTSHPPSLTELTARPAPSSTHNVESRLTSSQQPPAPTLPTLLSRISDPPLTTHSNGSKSLSSGHRYIPYPLSTAHYSSLPSTETSTQPSNGPSVTFQSNRAVSSIDTIANPPPTHFRSSRRAAERSQDTQQVQELTANQGTTRSLQPIPVSQEPESNKEKSQVGPTSKPSNDHQATHTTEKPRESDSPVRAQSPVSAANPPQPTSSQVTADVHGPHPDEQLSNGINIMSRPTRSDVLRVLRGRQPVSTIAPKEKSLRSKQKIPAKGDIVTAKIEGHPPWPGQVCDMEHLPAEILEDRPCPEITSTCADLCDNRICGEFTWPIRFFPDGEYAWVTSKDIFQLSQHEIVGYLQTADKSISADLIEGYEIALNPAAWLETQSGQEASLDNNRSSISNPSRGLVKDPDPDPKGIRWIERRQMKRKLGWAKGGPPALPRKKTRSDSATNGSAVKTVKKPARMRKIDVSTPDIFKYDIRLP